MQAPRAPELSPGTTWKSVRQPEEFVVGNKDDDEFEEPEELRSVTVERVPTERQRRENEGENDSVCTERCGGASFWSATPTSGHHVLP